MEVNDECPVVKAVLSRDDRYAQCVACVVRSVDVDPAYVRLLRVQTPVREEAHATVTAAEVCGENGGVFCGINAGAVVTCQVFASGGNSDRSMLSNTTLSTTACLA